MTAILEHDHWVQTDKGRLFARNWVPPSTQAGNPILLFHDSLGCVELWRNFPRMLATATGRRVVAYDRLGFGQSDPYPGKLPFDFVAAEARDMVPAVLTQLGMDRFVACGHSVGGGMAVETAARFPSRCAALVTVAAQAFVEDRTLAAIRAAERQFNDTDALTRLARYHGNRAVWVLDAWISTWLSPGFADWTLDDALASVRCPVLAIHGEFDEYGSRAHPDRIAGAAGRALILPGRGHVPHREDERRLVREIAEFLKDSGSDGVNTLTAPL